MSGCAKWRCRLFTAGKDELDEPFENDGVEVGHDKEAKSDGDNAEDFDVIVRADAVGKVFCDLAVKNDASPASGKNKEADDKSANIE